MNKNDIVRTFRSIREERERMINKILTALAVCLADQYGETVTAAAVEEEKTA